MNYALNIATIAAALFPGTGIAQTAPATSNIPPIIVIAQPITLAHWSARTTESLDRHLHYPSPMLNQAPPSGIVSVGFRCSDDGRPVAVTLVRTSKSRILDRAAIRAVAAIETLHPMPDIFKPGQTFVANVLFATDQDDYARQMVMLRKDAAERNARIAARHLAGVPADTAVAFNISLHASGS